jgi:RNase H-fold protein (predicted Holliday junction resolvase)
MTDQPPATSPDDMVVLAVDPGRAKCGVAVVSPRGVLHREIVVVSDIVTRTGTLANLFSPRCIVVGNGTGSSPTISALNLISRAIPIVPVDEAHTSELARARYLRENPPRGLRRLLPSFLRTPETPYDDYVAVILAERWLENDSAAMKLLRPGGVL